MRTKNDQFRGILVLRSLSYGRRLEQQAHLGMWDLRRLASVDSKSLNMVQDAQHTHWNVRQRKITTLQSKMLEKFAKTAKKRQQPS